MRIAVVIAARNEEQAIGRTIEATRLAAPTIPVYVVADRCEDGTALRARAAGARVFERRGGTPGKGPALAWFLAVASSDLDGMDALAILDADSRVRSGALDLLPATLSSEVGAVQMFVQPTADPGTPGSMLAAYSEWLDQAVDDHIRHRLGWPVPLRGTGMIVHLRVLREVLPLLRTRVEDVELTLLLLGRRQRILFAPDAVVEDPKPRLVRQLVRQRARWLQGHRELWRHRWREILRLAATGGPPMWWLLSSLLLKPRTLVMAAKAGVFIALFPFAAASWVRAVQLLTGASLAVDAARYVVGVAMAPQEWRGPVVRSLLASPVYLLVWIWSLLLSLTSRDFWLRARE